MKIVNVFQQDTMEAILRLFADTNKGKGDGKPDNDIVIEFVESACGNGRFVQKVERLC